MAESRALAAVARQGSVTQGQLAELRKEVLGLLRGQEGRRGVGEGNEELGRYLFFHPQHPDGNGNHDDPAVPIPEARSPRSPASMKSSKKGSHSQQPQQPQHLEARVAHLAAAVQRAEAARARERAEAQAALEAVRRALGAVGARAVEAARVQVGKGVDGVFCVVVVGVWVCGCTNG